MRTSAIKKKVAVKKSTTKVVKKIANKKASTAKAAAAAVSEKPVVQEQPNPRLALSKLTPQDIKPILGRTIRVHNATGQEIRGYGRTQPFSPDDVYVMHGLLPHRIRVQADMYTLSVLPVDITRDPLFPQATQVRHYYISPAAEIELVQAEEPRQSKPDLSRLAAAQLAGTIRSSKYHYQIGTDPELFITDKEGKLIPAFDFLPKREGKQIEPYWDGYQAEFGTNPTTCLGGQNGEISNGLNALRKLAKKVGGDLSVRSTFDIPPERLATDKDEHVAFGCTPSLSLYGEKFPSEDPRTIPFRTAGGHMHFEYTYKERIPVVIGELDRILSVIGVSLYQYYDEPRRRMLYGRAGEYRTTRYGFEYRTPGPSWLVHPFFINFQFELARRVIGMVNCYNGKPIKDWDASEEEVRECINTCDVALAHKIISRNKITFEAFMASLPGVINAKRHEALINCVLNGAHTIQTHPDRIDIYNDVAKQPNGGALNMGYGMAMLEQGEKI